MTDTSLQTNQQTASEFSAPYPGLRPFEVGESPLFYGRGTHIVGMLRILKRERILAVVGSSGCGKSSLVRAGLLPELAKGRGIVGQRDADWQFVISRPGSDPFDNLARALLSPTSVVDLDDKSCPKPDPKKLAECREMLESGPQGLIDAVDAYSSGSETHVLVLIDQFEEIFRFTDRNREASAHDGHVNPQGLNQAIAFVDLLLSTRRHSDSRIFVALTMRSDFLGDCDAFRELPETINQCQYLPPRLTQEEMRDAIARPPLNPAFDATSTETGTQTRKSGIDDEVVETLLQSLGDRQDQLPLIQHALMRMWSVVEGPNSQRPAQITVDVMKACEIEDSESVACALDQHASEIYGDEPQDGPTDRQLLIRRMFCALCEQRGDGRRVRRIQKVSGIAALQCGDSLTEQYIPAVIAVVEEFAQAGRNFLMVTPPGDVTEDSDIDISHESLIRNWDRLGDWLDEEEASADQYRRLVQTARLYADEEADLLTGLELKSTRKWKEEFRPNASWANRYETGEFDRVNTFLHDSEVEDKRLRQEAEDQAQKELQYARDLASAEQRKTATFRKMLVLVGVIALAAIGAAGIALFQSNEATAAKERAQAATRRANAEVGNAYWHRAVTARDFEQHSVKATLLFTASAAAFAQAEQPVRATSVLMAAEAVENVDNTFTHDGPIAGVKFSQDESRVLTWSYDGTARLWTVQRFPDIDSLLSDEAMKRLKVRLSARINSQAAYERLTFQQRQALIQSNSASSHFK